jgi:nitrogen fixation protein FixH
MTPQSTTRHEITGRLVLFAMLLFFGLIIAINVAFSVIAVRSFPGEDEKRSYLQGLRYNEKLAARDAQADLGWTATLEVVAAGDSTSISVRFADRNGRPVDGLSINGRMRRPATTRDDRALTFRDMGGGVYVADTGVLQPGGWMFQGIATRGTERFEFERRMSWTPLR